MLELLADCIERFSQFSTKHNLNPVFSTCGTIPVPVLVLSGIYYTTCDFPFYGSYFETTNFSVHRVGFWFLDGRTHFTYPISVPNRS